MKNKFMLWFVLVMFMFALTGCASKTALSTDKFVEVSEGNSLIISDVISQYSAYDYVNEATVSQSSDGWQVEFYVLSDDSHALGMFENNKSIFEDYKGTVSSSSSSNIGNYDTYSLTSGGYYMYLCRVDNTLFYARVEEKHKDNFKSLAEELGY